MDATATPRGTPARVIARDNSTFPRSLRPSTVFVDVCPRDTHTPHGLFCFCRTGISLSVEHPGRPRHIQGER